MAKLMTGGEKIAKESSLHNICKSHVKLGGKCDTEELRGIIIHETTLCVMMKHSSPQNVRQTVCLEEKDVGRDMYGFAACMSSWKTANSEKRRTLFGGTWQHT